MGNKKKIKKNRKGLLIIIILILLAITINLIRILIVNRKIEEKNQEIDRIEKIENQVPKAYTINFIENYSGINDKDIVQNTIDEFTDELMEKIYKENKNKRDEDLVKEFRKNKPEYRNLRTESDFVYLINELRKTNYTDATQILETKILSVKPVIENDYYKMLYEVLIKNVRTIFVLEIEQKQNGKIYFSKYNKFEEQAKTNLEPAGIPAEKISKIVDFSNNFKDNLFKVYLDVYNITNNDKLRYYARNAENLKKYGIYNEEAFTKIIYSMAKLVIRNTKIVDEVITMENDKIYITYLLSTNKKITFEILFQGDDILVDIMEIEV